MNRKPINPEGPRIQSALTELKGMIIERYPHAIFEVGRGEDPQSVHLIAKVDIEDPDEVGDLVLEQVLHYQLDERLPVHVIPIRLLKM